MNTGMARTRCSAPAFSQADEVLLSERKVLCLTSERKTSLGLES